MIYAALFKPGPLGTFLGPTLAENQKKRIKKKNLDLASCSESKWVCPGTWFQSSAKREREREQPKILDRPGPAVPPLVWCVPSVLVPHKMCCSRPGPVDMDTLLAAIKPRSTNHSLNLIFKSLPGKTWPRAPLQRARHDKLCRTHLKSTPETNYKAMSWPCPGLGQKTEI